MSENNDNSRNEVEIDLDKYMKLIDKLDNAEDTIKEMKLEAAEAKKRLAPPERKFMDLFLDLRGRFLFLIMMVDLVIDVCIVSHLLLDWFHLVLRVALLVYYLG